MISNRISQLICLSLFIMGCLPGIASAQRGNWSEAQTPGAEGVIVLADLPSEEMSPLEQAKSTMDLSSPRATLTSFLTAMNAANDGRTEYWTAALQCIYLLDIQEDERVAKGRELAQDIHSALTSITVDMETFKDAAELTEKVYEIELGDETKVPLSFRLNDDGVWRFSYSAMSNQTGELEDIVEEAEAAAEEVELDSRVDDRIATPRATMTTFLGAFREDYWGKGGLEEALLTLDLREIPSILELERGEELAILLKRILDRDKIIVLEEMSNSAAGNAQLVIIDPLDKSERRKIEIVPVPIPDSNAVEWKFSANSLSILESLWDTYYVDQDKVAGISSEAPQVLSLQIRDWMTKNAPYLMNKPILIENWKWLGLFLSILLGMIISRLVAAIMLRVLRRAFNREHLRLEQKLEIGFIVPIRIGLMAWVWWLALRPLSLPPEALQYIKVVIITVSSSAFVWATYRLVDILGAYISEKARLTESKYDDLVVPLIIRSLKLFVMCGGIIFVCQVNDIRITAALAGMGLVGMAIALAAQDTLGNVFGSLTVLMDRPFQIGDWVQIGDVDGNIESVGIRSTRVRTFYNSVVTVPNSVLTNAVIDNYGQRRYRRIKMDIGITYDTPPEKIDAFCEGIRELIRQHPYTRTDYYHVYLNGMGASSLDILLYCFHECPDWSTELRERHRLLNDIIRLAKVLGVEFAFPTSTLYMQQVPEGGKPDGGIITNDSALETGRLEATAIVNKYMGKNAPTPPPVNFDTSIQGGISVDDDEGN